MNNVVVFLKRWFETSTKKHKWMAILTVFGLLCTLMLFSLNRSTQTPADPLSSTPLYFAGAFIKLVVVLLLIFASAILARRWVQPGPHGKVTRQLRLVETVRLSPKQALHLISVGDQRLLIGATDQNIALITQMDDRLEDSAAEINNPQPILEFGSLLQAFDIHAPGRSAK
jgi:flagellar biosynthetic protein FliO